MNRSYQLVWNAALRLVQVSSEITRRGCAHTAAASCPVTAHGRRRALVVALGLGLAAPGGVAFAAILPSGPVVTSGAATITAGPDTLTVAQAAGAMTIDWTSFQIGPGGTVVLTQPTGSRADHRVTGATATQIDSTLNAQGAQSLFNGNGITLGSTARVVSDYLVLNTQSTGQAVTLSAGATVTGTPIDSSLELFGATIRTDADVTVYDFRTTAWRDNIVQAQGVITAEQVEATAAGDVHLDGYNRINRLSATAGGNLSVRSARNIFMGPLIAGGTTSLVSDGGIIARDGANALAGQVTIQSLGDAALYNTLPLFLGPSSAHELVLMAPGIHLQGDTMASTDASIFSFNQPLVQESGRLYVNGSATLDAGSANITLDNPSNVFYGSGGITASGNDIRIVASTYLSFSEVMALGHLHLSPGGAAPMVEFLGRTRASDIVVDGDIYVGPSISDSENIRGDVALSGRMIFNTLGWHVFNGNITGASALYMQGSSSFQALNGRTQVNGLTHASLGTLLIGDALHPGATLDSDAVVHLGAALGGTGQINGNVTVESGGRLSPGDGIGTLTINGTLALQNASGLSVEVGLPGTNAVTAGQSDRIHVNGDLSVADGTLVDVVNAGGMGAGMYTILDYTGRYIGNGWALGLSQTPMGSSLQLINDIGAKRVDVIDADNTAVNFWNGNGLASTSRVGGGSGTWNVLSPNWASPDGSRRDIMTPQPGYAVFAGDRGDVRVDGSAGTVVASGMQFATDGYTVSGDPVTLLAPNGAAPIIRVGTGTAGSAAMTATIASTIRGNQGLRKDDYGTLVLTAANLYTGGTTVARGTLAVADDRSLGDASGGLTLDGGTLRIDGTAFSSTRRSVTLGPNGGGIDVSDASHTLTLNQPLAGTGGLTKRGAGTLVMTGANTYSGSTTVAAGTLRVAPGALRGSLTDDATVVFDQTTDGLYAGSIDGQGEMVKEGQGTLMLVGTGGFTGHTQVNAGTLQIGSSAVPSAFLGGDVGVAQGARLSGVGAIGGDLVSHGTVAPGATLGVLSVGGNATLSSDSSLYIDTAPEGASRLDVGGHLTIDKARLVVDSQGRSWMANTPYNLVTARGGISGQFASVDSNFAFLNAIVAYNASGTVSLALQRNAVSFLDTASTPNQRAVAVAADSAGAGHDVYDQVVAMDAASARQAFTALAGDLHASVQSVVIDDQRQVRDAVSRHLLGDDDGRQGVHADDGSGVDTWLSVLGHDADYDGNANAGKIDSSGSGALLGADVAVDGDARIGALLGHARQSLHERSLDGSAKVRSNQFGLYGDVAFDALTLRGGIVHAHHDIDTTRHVTLGEASSRLGADRDTTSTQGFVEGGYALHPGARTRLEPFAQIATVRWNGDSATEQGGVGALAIDDRDAHVTTGKLGLHAGMATDATHVVGWQATVAWQHASGDTTPSARLRFAEGGESFDVSGVPLARNATTVDAGLSFRLSPAVHLDASYTGQYASGLSDHGGRVSLGVSF